MISVRYDKTFTGFLSAVFDVYEYKLSDVRFGTSDAALFGESHNVTTSEENSQRVWKGLKKMHSGGALQNIYKAYLSEHPEIENLLLRYIRYAFGSNKSIENDFSNEAVLTVSQTARKVHREKHRMEAFIRFKLTQDGLYYATVDPDFNVLPLIISHFKNRYADQKWMIYDTRRKYGIHYDLQHVTTITLQPASALNDNALALPGVVLDENEMLYEELWKNYFNSVNIPARKNMKLHIKHMPFRYWKYLIEKGGCVSLFLPTTRAGA